MLDERLEYLISQYADGTLPQEQRVAVEDRLAVDAEARSLLAEYRSLNQLLKSAPLPEIRWDSLAGAISSAVDRQAEAMAASTENEQLELAITRHIDGELPPQELAALEARLAADPAARHMHDQHRSLALLLRGWLPAGVDYQRLGERLSQTIAEEARRSRMSIAWVRQATRLALAACLLVAIGLAVHLARPLPDRPGAVAQITGPSAEPAAGEAVVEITLGPSEAWVRRGPEAPIDLVSMPTQLALVESAHPRPGAYVPMFGYDAAQ